MLQRGVHKAVGPIRTGEPETEERIDVSATRFKRSRNARCWSSNTQTPRPQSPALTHTLSQGDRLGQTGSSGGRRFFFCCFWEMMARHREGRSCRLKWKKQTHTWAEQTDNMSLKGPIKQTRPMTRSVKAHDGTSCCCTQELWNSFKLECLRKNKLKYTSSYRFCYVCCFWAV